MSPFSRTSASSAFVKRLLSGAAAARRFPAAVACALVAAVAAALAVDGETTPGWWVLFRLASLGLLGLPLFIGLTLYCEQRAGSPVGTVARRAAHGLAFGVLVLLYVLFNSWGFDAFAQRYGHLTVTLHLAVAVAPYLGRRGERWGFWQYNRSLLTRFLLAGIYAGTIFAGLSLAMVAVDNLPGIEVDDLAYPRLFMIMGFFFHPVIFLAGVPRRFARLEEDRSYPAVLKVFCRNVLLPLVAVYVTILTVYLGRVLVTGSWPSGWISYLVSIMSAAGILSLLMIHPQRLARGNEWINRYALAFWIAILPSVAMVLMAAWQRIEQYGITERRYLLLVVALWLAGTAIYFVARRTRTIMVIPLTLAALGVVTFVGPWSAYAVAERSQRGRVGEILSDHGALAVTEGDTVEIPFDAWVEARTAMHYLVRTHGMEAVSPLLPERAQSSDAVVLPGPEASQRERREATYEEVARLLGDLGVRPGPAAQPIRLLPSGPPRPTPPIPLSGFDLLIVDFGHFSNRVNAWLEGGDTLEFALAEGGQEIMFSPSGSPPVGRASLVPLFDMAEELHAQSPAATRPYGPDERPFDMVRAPTARMTLDLDGAGWSVRLVFAHLAIEPVDSRMAATGFGLQAVLIRRPDRLP